MSGDGEAKRWQRIIKLSTHNPRIIIGGALLVIIVTTAIIGPLLSPYALDASDLSLRLIPPSAAHWLGCDLNGRDLLTCILYGARTSLYIAFATVLISVTVGSIVGLLSGYAGGWVDMFFMRLVDILMSVPGILIALVLASFLGAGANNVILAIAVTGWTSAARLMRGQVLSLRERDYVIASRTLGASHLRLMFKHIAPGTITPLIVHATFSLSGVILIESSLSFLGLGAQENAPTWGALLGQGRTVLTEAPHLSVSPGIAIMLLVLALNFLGDGLRDALDPRLQSN